MGVGGQSHRNPKRKIIKEICLSSLWTSQRDNKRCYSYFTLRAFGEANPFKTVDSFAGLVTDNKSDADVKVYWSHDIY